MAVTSLEQQLTRRQLIIKGLERGLELYAGTHDPLTWLQESLLAKDSRVEQLERLGMDGQTIWRARPASIPNVELRTLRSDQKILALNLEAIDFQVTRPIIVANHSIYGQIPTVTGKPATYYMYMGEVDSDENFFFNNERIAPQREGLACYTHIERYYDNKIVNATLSLLAVGETMLGNPIVPGGTFSYLQAAKVGELIKMGIPLWGKGIGRLKDGTEDLVPMYAGGLCMSVDTIAKMARRAEVIGGYVKIGKIKAHSVVNLQYFKNPLDPVPQVDATAYYPSVDLTFDNLTDKNLYVAPQVQIIPDAHIPRWYNGYYHDTATIVMSFTLTTTPMTLAEQQVNQTQLDAFRLSRGI